MFRSSLTFSMGSSQSSLSSPSLKCPICLDVFSQPVTTPCGHNFCKPCLDTYWKSSASAKCPLCQKVFPKRPELLPNVLLRDLLGPAQGSTQSTPQSAPPRDVQCGPCAAGGQRVQAVRSCLHCEESYCSVHLRAHQTDPQLLVHELLRPVHRLQARVCKKHAAPLDLVCHDDLTAVCVTCMSSEHVDHTCVPLKNRLRDKKGRVSQELSDVRQKIQERRTMMESCSEADNTTQRNSVSDIAELMKLLALLQQLLKLNQAAAVAALVLLQKKSKDRSEKLKKRLQTEVQQLEGRQGALERLARAEDGLHLLQNWSSLGAPPHLEDWSHTSPFSDAAVGTSRSTLSKVLIEVVAVIKEATKALETKEVQRVQQYAVQVTLDAHTANPVLCVSPDGSEVYHTGVPQPLPDDNPQSFDTLQGVLSKQGFISGAFYFEVQVEGSACWDVGIALETVDRKNLSTLSLSSGFAVLSMRDGTLKACDRPPLQLRLPSGAPQKIGVFVEVEEGEVAFYDVTQRSHIYSFTGCRFPRVKLHAYLSPCAQESAAGKMTLIPVTCASPSQSEAAADSSSDSSSDSDLDLDFLTNLVN